MSCSAQRSIWPPTSNTILLHFYVHDHLYSPVALVQRSSLNVLERYEYDAYGNCHVLEPNFAPDPDGISNYPNPYLFTASSLDILNNGPLKLQYNRNRYYDQYTGRWLTHDPLGYVDGMNLYEYVTSAPISNWDPMGQGLISGAWHCLCCLCKSGKVAKECKKTKPEKPAADAPLEDDVAYLEKLDIWKAWCYKKIVKAVPSCLKCIWAMPGL